MYFAKEIESTQKVKADLFHLKRSAKFLMATKLQSNH